MGEIGCLKDGNFHNLKVEGQTLFTGGLKGIGGGGIVLTGGVGEIPSHVSPTPENGFTAGLMLDNAILNYAGTADAANALFATGTEIETALIARGVVPTNGMSFDVYINNSDADATFTFADINGITGITSANLSSNDNTVIARNNTAGLSPCAHFRFIRTAANAYTVFNLGSAAD